MPEFEFERDRAYRLLLDFFLGGDFDTDTSLSERKLAETLHMGRMPIREALRDLSRDGLLESRPGRGTFLRPLSVDDLREIYEVRYALEGMAAHLAAQNGLTEELAAYDAKFKAMLASPDDYELGAVYDLGAEFHLSMFRAAKNQHLYDIYEPLRLRFRIALGLPKHYDHARVFKSVEEHIEILDAIRAGDSLRAQQLVCRHLAAGLDVRTRIFEKLKDYAGPAAASA
ncbi:GntR family transcriptional regulator [Martelella radicis]|uniref:DNA-binding GntR family transcriptional regulator n=1 Tax=Martelella radicis TaxID=1397476 RepID=A0A7W6KNJ7_9HYPH|nr:GntR family transcriptional regulator [Martelella radicis]MBB4124566.1 DNA-binding GntR family transcriptional regulator [Martelella radicis]